MPAAILAIQPGRPLGKSTDAVYANFVFNHIFRQSLMPEGDHRHLVAATSQLNTQILNETFFTPNDGRIKLGQHQDAHGISPRIDWYRASSLAAHSSQVGRLTRPGWAG